MADKIPLGLQTCHQDQWLTPDLRVFEKMEPEVTGVRFAHWQLSTWCLAEQKHLRRPPKQTKQKTRDVAGSGP